MAQQIPETPGLPGPPRGLPVAITTWAGDLIRVLSGLLAQSNIRLNRVLPKDGTEDMTGRLTIANDSGGPLLTLTGLGGSGDANDQLRLINPNAAADGEKTTITFFDATSTKIRAAISAHDDTASAAINHIGIETSKADETTVVTRFDITWGVDLAVIGFKNVASVDFFVEGDPATENIFRWKALNTTPARVEVANSRVNVLSNTAGSESSEFQFQTKVAGTSGTRMRIGQGIQAGTPTGGDKGSGTLNLDNELYKDGTQLLTTQQATVADASGGGNVDAEARTAINDLLARLRTHGIIAT